MPREVPLWVVVAAASAVVWFAVVMGLRPVVVWLFWFAAAFAGIVALERAGKWALGRVRGAT